MRRLPAHSDALAIARAAHPHRCARAFTLVELLVAIGIIAIPIAILLPTLNGARKRANAVRCMSNLRQLGQALVMYSQANRGYVIPSYTMTGTSTVYANPERALGP
jgi:prepilin-type N-terminal cleavage/methylation domain-containing protein